MKMRMRSGLLVDPLNLRVEDVRIEDIAHGLARINRFNGQARIAYSVARHSVNVCRRLAVPVPGMSDLRSLMLLGLLHDAPEAYLGDVIRPIKSRVRMQYDRVGQESFDELEARTMNVIFTALGIPHAVPPTPHGVRQHALWSRVALADDAQLEWEQRGLFEGGDVVIQTMSAEESQVLFLTHYNDLRAGVGYISTAVL